MELFVKFKYAIAGNGTIFLFRITACVTVTTHNNTEQGMARTSALVHCQKLERPVAWVTAFKFN